MIFDELDWDYVVAMALNNTNTNIGDKKSLKYCTLAKNVEVFFIAGCNCHLAHLAADKGGEGYTAETGFDCEDHQVDLYYFLNKARK